MKAFLLGALLLLTSILVALPTAAATDPPTCVGRNPTDNQCEIGSDFFATSPYSWCLTLSIDPPVHGLSYYAAACTPNLCAYPEINCNP
jgi:hypothetical protein